MNPPPKKKIQKPCILVAAIIKGHDLNEMSNDFFNYIKDKNFHQKSIYTSEYNIFCIRSRSRKLILVIQIVIWTTDYFKPEGQDNNRYFKKKIKIQN